MKETDLFPPVRDYFEEQGFRVLAEVKDCDVIALRDDAVVVIELKTSANMSLLIQATDRLAVADEVYVAVPQPKRLRSSHWRGTQRVIKRLGLGLMMVSFGKLGASANLLFPPSAITGLRRNHRKRRALLKEAGARHENFNLGGSTRETIVTAYRQDAILIATFLLRLGPSAPKTLHKLGTSHRTRLILAANHYGWFERVERGVYALTSTGEIEVTHIDVLFSRASTMVDEALTDT